MKLRRIVEKPKAWFQGFAKPEDYVKSGCLWCEPMLAQEISEQEQTELFNSSSILVEEKFDGTRGILQFFDNEEYKLTCVPDGVRGFTRCFSRRVSRKTQWFCENTDSLPHLRGIDVPDLAGTIIDGEMFIDGRPFKDVSATLNCKPDEAIRRQQELGNITFHAFDILHFRNVNCEKMPLIKRKEYLKAVIDAVNHPNLVMVPYYDNDRIEIHFKLSDYLRMQENRARYPTLWTDIQGGCKQENSPLSLDKETLEKYPPDTWCRYFLSRRGYYEYIVLTGGEGVILKPKNGRYFHKRGKEYMKVKKFLTREVILTGYKSPEFEYQGSFPKDQWSYWVEMIDDVPSKVPVDIANSTSAKELLKLGYTPVTKFWYNDQIGTLVYGVILDEEDKSSISKLPELECVTMQIAGEEKEILIVGECSGITDGERCWITRNADECIGRVIEVKANELFKDTGKLRHPRFLRFRDDKDSLECTWKNHIGV